MGKGLKDKVSSFVQLDIFNIIEEQKKIELQTMDTLNPMDLVVGDIVEFVSYGGKLLTGIYLTKGFWDGRDQEKPQYYYIDVEGYYYEMNPSVCAWKIVGHDANYTKPNKNDITEKLIRHLKNYPFTDRLSAYREFQNQYPYLSYEYHPYVSKAWEKAIVEVTTMEEVIANLKHWSIREKFNKEVTKSLAENVLSLRGEERLKEMFNIKWAEAAWRDGQQVKKWSKRFAFKTMSVYESLLRTLIEKARNANELIGIASLWRIEQQLVDVE